MISESSDGVNFSPPVPISFHPASDGIIDSRPAIALRADGGRYVAWDSASTATLRYSIKIARSDEGGVFGPVTTVVEDGLVSSPALALSSKAVYVGWNDWGFNSNAAFDTGGRLMITSSPLGKLAFDAPQEIAKTSIGFARKITAMPDKGVNPNLHLAVDPLSLPGAGRRAGLATDGVWLRQSARHAAGWRVPGSTHHPTARAVP